jgi:hypothetical protein
MKKVMIAAMAASVLVGSVFGAEKPAVDPKAHEKAVKVIEKHNKKMGKIVWDAERQKIIMEAGGYPIPQSDKKLGDELKELAQDKRNAKEMEHNKKMDKPRISDGYNTSGNYGSTDGYNSTGGYGSTDGYN